MQISMPQSLMTEKGISYLEDSILCQHMFKCDATIDKPTNKLAIAFQEPTPIAIDPLYRRNNVQGDSFKVILVDLV